MLKNPKRFREEVKERNRHRGQLVAPTDERSIQALVEQLLKPEPDPDTRPLLRLLESRAVPALIRALGDPRFNATKLGSGLFTTSPLERVLDALAVVADARAVEAVSPFVRHEEAEIRKTAALALGAIGVDSCLTPIATSLRDSDEHVRVYALIGIERGLQAGRSTPSFCRALFEPLVTLLDDSYYDNVRTSARLLLRIDRDQAVTVLLSERVLSARNPNVAYIIEALNAADERIPADRLMPLIQPFPGSGEYPNDSACAEGLIALARSRHPEAEKLIRKGLDSGNRYVRRGAADALVILKGALTPFNYFLTNAESLTYETFTPPQRFCYAVDQLNGEVSNGGFAQYFFNPLGDRAADALAGLQAIKASRTADILKRAMGLFGPAGPSADYEKRQDQLAAFSEEQDATLRQLDSQFYEKPDDLDVLMSLYAAEHPEHFRASP